MSVSALRISDIHKNFGGTRVIDNVSLDIGEGEFIVLLGPSGSGKTTLLRIVAGFEKATSGDVRIRGRSVGAVPPNLRGIGMVFQHFALFPHLSVFRNVAFGLEMRRMAGDVIRRKVMDALGVVKLADLARRMPNELSGGQKQRVAIARALVTEPALLLLDEPLGSLDTHLRVEMQAELRRLQKEFNITTIMVTHDQEEAMVLGDRIAILKDGRLRQVGAPSEVYDRPQSAFVARFMGAANVFDVADIAEEGDALRITSREGVVMSVARNAVQGPLSAIQSVILRPEVIEIGPGDGGRGANRHQGTLASLVHVGPVSRLTVRLDGGTEIAVTTSGGSDVGGLKPGDRVTVGWQASSALPVAG
ncbi:ABC transporter ATP-binding protein [Bosea sp. (in: a-proteobacteria)]|uniref:ABC transporter ATP-binding protein n=1 Tax=Bosea sp. (in: a-proteobacteria) TaxID=1871050 RepID=UPI0026251D73|nr:ABC transporter ATP-binding protein [Bosea sp. (in: a-proteobacteria)]MCO5089832.1 ABC transporter ATP-binding protein [Bosea sp. (in: a-proteobacteria)]